MSQKDRGQPLTGCAISVGCRIKCRTVIFLFISISHLYCYLGEIQIELGTLFLFVKSGNPGPINKPFHFPEPSFLHL